jgi:hypothetical protein
MMLRIFLNVFYRPVEAFKSLADKNFNNKKFFLLYGAPLILLGSLGRTSISLVRYETSRSNSCEGKDLSLFALLFTVNLAAYLIALLLGTHLISKLAPRFGSVATAGSFLSVIVLAYTPFLLAQPIAAMVQYGQTISIVGMLYTLLLYVLGMRTMTLVPQKHIIGFTMLSFFILFGIFHIVALISSGLFIFGIN